MAALGFFNSYSTPEQLARRRAELDAVANGMGRATNVGAGIGDIFKGLAVGYGRYKTGKAEKAGTDSANAAWSAFNPFPTPQNSPPVASGASGGMSAPQAQNSAVERPMGAAMGSFGQPKDTASGIVATAKALGINPIDLGTAISYETAGTFDPVKAGPRTQWGQHRGAIQWGEPQAKKYGVDWKNPIGSQYGENGAIARYLTDAGVKPGMGLMDIYSAINAGKVGRYNASDANNGGAPGTVADKVNQQMAAHRAKAAALLQAQGVQVASNDPRQAFAAAAPQVQPAAYQPPMPDQAAPQAPMQQQPQQADNQKLQEMWKFAQSPAFDFLSTDKKALFNNFLQQEMQKQDPMYQMKMRQSQVDLETGQYQLNQLKNPRAKVDHVGNSLVKINPDNTVERIYTDDQGNKRRTQVVTVNGQEVLYDMDTGDAIKTLGKSPAKQDSAPTGHRFKEDGKTLERIPGYRDTNLEMDMRKEFDAQTKDFRTVRDAYNRVQASAENPSPAGDLSLIFNYMKMLDPGSVVRESEFATAANAAPLLTRYGLDPEKLKGVWEGQRLTPEQRADFVAKTEALYAEQDDTFQALADQYSTTASRNGLDPANIILTPRQNPRKKKPSTANQKPIEQMSDQELEAIINGQ